MISGQSEGLWKRDFQRQGVDSNVRSQEFNPYMSGQTQAFHLAVGAVLLPQPEPIWKQTTVSVDLITNGILTNVGWPGPNVEVNLAGIPSPGATAIHGLWEAPMPGQQVVVGFVEGDMHNAIVLNKYSYNAHQSPYYDACHFLPMTTKLIGPTDVVLGHHTGSYIALRGTLPLPAQIDIFCMSLINMIATAGFLVTTPAAWTTTVGAAYTITAGAAVSITAGATMSLMATGSISLTSVASATITVGLAEIDINPTGITIVDAVGNEIQLSATGIKLITGDATAWAPCIITNCIFSGAPHGGVPAGISRLLGG